MGRVRSVEAHRRALAAAADVLTERGVEGLSVDEVAARSGVAKTTIYRHWDTRLALALDAFRSCAPVHPTPNTGDLRRDLVECFTDIAAAGADDRTRRVFVALMHAAAQDPALDRLHQQFLEERERPVRTVLQLAQARGELPADLDLPLAVDLLVGPLVFRVLVRRAPVSQEDLARVVDLVVDGLQAPLAAPPP